MYERHEVYERMAANIVVQWAEGLFSLELVHGARKRERERETAIYCWRLLWIASCGLRAASGSVSGVKPHLPVKHSRSTPFLCCVVFWQGGPRPPTRA
jgi:hypothetical protein|eukprot:SAG25_NODE_216_length_11681_cov_7.180021_9_plen_98_part_00